MKKASTTKNDVAEKANAPFPARLRALMDREQMKQGELADLLDVTRQSANQYCLGLSFPDPEKLCKISRHFNVTTDYLLGLSVISSTDPNMKMACDYTGLSEAAIQQLRQLNDDVFSTEELPYVTPISVLSEIISQGDNFVFLMDYIMQGYVARIKETIENSETMSEIKQPEFLKAKNVIQKYGYSCFQTKETAELYYLQAMTGMKIICDDLTRQIAIHRKEK